MFVPKKTKYRKAFKGRIKGNATRGGELAFGCYGLKSLEPERIVSKQIEAARRTITRTLKRAGKVWCRIFPDTPVSKKPADVRMGKGKGSVEYWAFKTHPGRILFEVSGVPLEIAKEALMKAASKFPVKCKFVVED